MAHLSDVNRTSKSMAEKAEQKAKLIALLIPYRLLSIIYMEVHTSK